MVVPGKVKPCSGPMMWTMPWRLSNSLKYSNAEVARVLRQRLDLLGAFRIGIGQRAVRRRHVVIDNGERLFRRMHFAAGRAQAFESLRRRHLMHEMAVDIEQRGAVRLFVDQMVFPDFVVKSARFHD